MTRRLTIRIAIIVALFVVGIFFLLRSCLSSHDERASIGGNSSSSGSQFLLFEKEGKGVIFSLVKFDKAISYSKKGGSIRKSVTSTYYAQANDLTTAAKTATQKIKGHGQVKSYPVEIIGASGNKAWIFAGELMAYDPFTLMKEADATILEEKNPVLKGKLINERRYYNFDNNTQLISITAADGGRYSLNTTTLIATAMDDEDIITDNTAGARIKELDQLTMQIKEQRNAVHERLKESNRLYREKQISLNQYKDSSSLLKVETDRLGKLFDSLGLLAREARTAQRTEEANNRKTNARRAGHGFGGMRVNCDTMDGQWYGLFSNEEITKVSQQFDYRTVNDDAARNKLFTAAITQKNNNWIIGDEKKKTGNAVYLQGGFLLNRETGLPVHLPAGFLIVHKDIIGNDGKVQLTSINTNGEQAWTIPTGLKEFYDWQLRGHQLVITGTDNKDLGAGRINLLLVINLQNGAIAAYDFFEDKVRE